jgi:hypothetical protein
MKVLTGLYVSQESFMVYFIRKKVLVIAEKSYGIIGFYMCELLRSIADLYSSNDFVINCNFLVLPPILFYLGLFLNFTVISYFFVEPDFCSIQ